MSTKKVSINCGGCGCITLPILITAVFVVLKLSEAVDWSWWFVFAPLLFGPALVIAVSMFALSLAIILVPLVIVIALLAAMLGD